MKLAEMMNQLVADAELLVHQFTGDIHWETCNALADQYELWEDDRFPLWLSAVVSHVMNEQEVSQ